MGPTSSSSSSAKSSSSATSSLTPTSTTRPPASIPASTSLASPSTSTIISTSSSVFVVTQTIEPSPIHSSSATAAAAAQSFLQNKALSGSVFAAIGIVFVVCFVFAASAFVRRRQRKRLISEAVSFDPGIVDTGYHKDSNYGNATPIEKDGGSIETYGRRSESSSGHDHGIVNGDAGYAQSAYFATRSTPANPWQTPPGTVPQHGYGEGYGQAPTYGGGFQSGYLPDTRAQQPPYGIAGGPSTLLRPLSPIYEPPLHLTNNYTPRVPPALNTTPGTHNTPYEFTTVTDSSTIASGHVPESSLASGLNGSSREEQTTLQASHSDHGMGTMPVAAPLPDRFGWDESPAPKVLSIPDSTSSGPDGDAVLSYNLRDFPTPPQASVLKVNC